MIIKDKDKESVFGYWAKMPEWTLDEAVCLIACMNPKRFLAECNERSNGDFHYNTDHGNYYKLAKRFVEKGILKSEAPPTEYIKWADDIKIPVPQKLRDLVMKRNNQTNWETEYKKLKDETDKIIEQQKTQIANLESKKAGNERQSDITRKQSTLLKLVAVMGFTAYKYDPKNGREHNACKEIEGDSHLYGHSIDEDTVRKWLKKASEEFPRNKDFERK